MSEVELHSRVVRHQSAFVYNVMQHQVQDFLSASVDKYLNQPNLRISTVFENHFNESKTFGVADKDGLMLDTMLCLAFCKDHRVPKSFRADAFELGASMLWETAFIDTVESHNAPATVDDRLELVDAGSSFLKHASTLIQKDDMEKTQRLLLKSLFSQAMRDVVAGEVTIATRDELLLALRDARSQLKFIKDLQAKNGLLGEIAALESFWQEYSKQGDKVALPSSVRGGDGHFRREETHDIDILRQRRDDSWIVLTPVEVKWSELTPAIRERYTKSHLAHVAASGVVTLSGAHRAVPNVQ